VSKVLNIKDAGANLTSIRKIRDNKVKLPRKRRIQSELKLHQWRTVKGGGHWGLSETEKPAKIFTKTEKPEEKSLKTEKNAENNDQYCKFGIFNPSALDTTAKILALGTIQCPCYTACSANLMRIIPKKIFAMFNQRNCFFHRLRLIWRWNFCNS